MCETIRIHKVAYINECTVAKSDNSSIFKSPLIEIDKFNEIGNVEFV